MGNGIQEQRDRLREEREAERLVSEVPRAPRVPSPRARRVSLSFGAAAGIVLVVGAAFLMVGTIPALGLAWDLAKGGTRGFFGDWGALFLLFPAIGAAMVFFTLRGHWRRRVAFRTGTPVLARVVYAGADPSTTVNGRHPFLITWEFVAEDGASYQGSVSSMKRAELEEFAARQQLVVLYDPARPQANALWVE